MADRNPEVGEFWKRLSDYDRRFSTEDYRGNGVAAALKLRREADDMLDDLSEFADWAGDSDDSEDYIRWLQKAGNDISSRIDLALGRESTAEDVERQMAMAYAVLRAIARDALERRDWAPQPA